MVTDLKITLKIATPAGPFEGTFDAETKVHDVIAFVVKEKRLAKEDEYELARDGESLDPDKALSTLDIKDGDVLDLVASGSAV
ncbi:MAG: hypothetical protein F4X58_12650 [Chloroflexi bacterium]|nr:hypothetical protein [Chloroflexota bacterium]MYC02760.1 hypothetical protein [Chloroflexota bacterium]